MELYEYFVIFGKYKKIIALLTLGGLVIASMISFAWARGREATFSLIVRPKIVEKTDRFSFSDILQASDLMTRMGENWLNEGGFDIRTRRLGSQVIRVSFFENNQEAAKNRMADIEHRTNVFLASLSPTQGLGAFEALGADFSFYQRNPQWKYSLSTGFFLGLLAGLMVALFLHYLEGWR